MRIRSTPFVLAVMMFAPVALKASVPALVRLGVVTDVEAEAVVNAPVLGVVAPTVPLIGPLKAVALTVPVTSSFSVGEVVPMPTLPPAA
jgi:hypothetical protein